MATYELRVIEDRFRAGAVLSLPALNRVVYVVEGTLALDAGGGDVALAANEAWRGAGACRLTAGREAALAWRWELVRPGGSEGTALKVAREVTLEPGAQYLMRCDRVDFPPGGVAYTHTHRGPGIRVLLQGELRVEVGVRASLVRPGDAWFESGPEPVYAAASDSDPTSFVRVLVLPAELRGKSSIRYVRPEDQDKPKTQRYTVFVDAPIVVE